MKHYTFTIAFRALYDKAVALYARGQRGAGSFFSPEEQAFLAANGLTPQHLYDYAEDATNEGEPDFGTAVGIELIRRDYFINVQNGVASARVLDASTLPPKDAAIEGISWLPRIIPKAQAKLRGELPPSLMYGCGGDRNFLSTHDIHPAEFLRLVWTHLDDPAALVNWVKRRSRPE
jgi:hypothetical protein